jgi:hypothetical protein
LLLVFREAEGSGIWGGEPEMKAFTDMYKRSIRTFNYSMQETRLFESFLEAQGEVEGEPINLLLLNGHYWLLWPVNAEPPSNTETDDLPDLIPLGMYDDPDPLEGEGDDQFGEAKEHPESTEEFKAVAPLTDLD